MPNQKLNAREYPLPDTFLYDLKIELGWNQPGAPGAPLPAEFDREFPQALAFTKSLRGLTFRTVPGDPPRIVATWAYPRPDGSTRTMEATIPEAIRAVMATAPAPSGDEMVTAVYQNTLPEVLAAFNADWGVG